MEWEMKLAKTDELPFDGFSEANKAAAPMPGGRWFA
jgi:hypothetical protein